MHSDRAWSVCRRLEEKRVETVPGSPTYIDYWLEGACPTFQNNETWCCCSMDTKVAGTAGVFNNLFCTPVSGCASDAHEQTAKCIPNVEASLPQADESIPMEVIFGVGGGVLFLVLVIFAGVIWFVRKDMVDILNAIRGKHKKDGTHGKMSITPSASNSASSSSRGAGGGGSRVGFSSRDGNSSKGLLGQDDGWGVGGGAGLAMVVVMDLASNHYPERWAGQLRGRRRISTGTTVDSEPGCVFVCAVHERPCWGATEEDEEDEGDEEDKRMKRGWT